MHPLRALLIYFGAIFVGGALLAPWIYWLVQWAGEHIHLLQRLANEPFHRYLMRTFLFIALAGLWPFALGVGASSWSDVGLARPKGQWSKLGAGLLLGFGSLAVLAALSLFAGVRRLDTGHSAAAFTSHVFNVGLTATVVATLEELIFRGALFGAFRKAYRWTTALVVSSVLYALVHFFEQPEPPAQVNWASGLVLLPKMASGFFDLHTVVPGFFNLTLVGIILGLAYQWSGNLYFSIGLHAGWIFWVKSYAFLTNPTTMSNLWFWGSRKLIDGWLALFVLGVTLLLARRMFSERARASNA
jgi:membrane protease YdiL (CAAX protease family)